MDAAALKADIAAQEEEAKALSDAAELRAKEKSDVAAEAAAAVNLRLEALKLKAEATAHSIEQQAKLLAEYDKVLAREASQMLASSAEEAKRKRDAAEFKAWVLLHGTADEKMEAMSGEAE